MTRAFGDWLTHQQIEQRVIALVADARRSYGLPNGCAGAEACRRMGLTWRCGPLKAGTDGFWSNGLIVVNQAIDWPARVEFTIFHEITHLLMDDDGELIEYFTDTLRRNEEGYKSAIERCCNQGAAEFLMPQSFTRRLMAERGFSVHLVQELAELTGASLIAAAAQVAVCAPIDCFVAICASGLIPRSWPPKVGWHIEYAFAPYRGKYTLARFTPIPDDHVIALAGLDRRYLMDNRSFVPFRSGRRMPGRCEVSPVGSRLVVLLEIEQRVPGGQQELPWSVTTDGAPID